MAVEERAGTSVNRGETIGRIGWNTAAAPVLHYEVLVNGRFVDPMRIRLPALRRLEGATLAAFERERDRLESMTAQANTYDLFSLR